MRVSAPKDRRSLRSRGSFSEHHGGEAAETSTTLMPAGGTPRLVRYLWRDPARLLAEPLAGS